MEELMLWLSGIFRLFTNKYVLLGFIALATISSIYFTIKRDERIVKEQTKIIEVLNNQLAIATLERENMSKTLDLVGQTIQHNTRLLKEIQDDNAAINASIQKELKASQDERLARLAAQKPGLIEIKVNKATGRVFNQVMLETRTFYEANK